MSLTLINVTRADQSSHPAGAASSRVCIISSSGNCLFQEDNSQRGREDNNGEKIINPVICALSALATASVVCSTSIIPNLSYSRKSHESRSVMSLVCWLCRTLPSPTPWSYFWSYQLFDMFTLPLIMVVLHLSSHYFFLLSDYTSLFSVNFVWTFSSKHTHTVDDHRFAAIRMANIIWMTKREGEMWEMILIVLLVLNILF